MRTLAVVLAFGTLLAVASSASARPAVRLCGEITVRKGGNDYTYRIKVFQAPLACTTAQATMSRFILSGKIPRHWFCRYGHSRDAWAATCARTAKNAPIVRAYLVAG